MSPRSAVIQSLRERLWDAGFRPLAIYNVEVGGPSPGKRPVGIAWEERARRDPPAVLSEPIRNDALNTGILCDGLRPVDIDVDDLTRAHQIRALAIEMLGDAPVRYRLNSPRCMLIYRAAEGAPDKFTLAGKGGKVEILGKGGQFVAFGCHETGVELQWTPESLEDISADALPVVTEQQIADFLDQAAPFIGAEAPSRKSKANGHDTTGAAAPHNAEAAADVLDIAAALAAIPNEGAPDWDDWNRVGMATWAASAGSSAGFAAWCAWSEKNPAHNPAACSERWQHYPSSPPDQTGGGKLFKLARDAFAGWIKPSEFIEQARKASEQSKGEGNSDPHPIALIDPRKFEGVEVPDRQWIVPHWIPMARPTSLYGAPGEGKTLLAQMLATACALGKPWLGLHVRQCNSLLHFCEDDEDEMWRRQDAINGLYGCTFADLGAMRWLPRLGHDNLLMAFPSGTPVLSPLFNELLKIAMEHCRGGLVVTDTLADVFGGNENDRGQARSFVQGALGRIARQTGGAVLTLAHPSLSGMTNGTGTSGSTGWIGTFRSHLHLASFKPDEGTPDPDLRVLTRGKANFARRGETIEMRWRDGVFVADAPTTGILGSIERRSAEAVFLALLARFTTEGRFVSDNSRAGNYAPRAFARCPDGERFKSADFHAGMERLFRAKTIKSGTYQDARRRPQSCIILAEEPAS